uniref:Uncharacterized protein n=1 Tax=Oryzias latipes TaxID=8090 RepID=A0A3P9IBZ7_ORYLA
MPALTANIKKIKCSFFLFPQTEWLYPLVMLPKKKHSLLNVVCLISFLCFSLLITVTHLDKRKERGACLTGVLSALFALAAFICVKVFGSCFLFRSHRSYLSDEIYIYPLTCFVLLRGIRGG